MICTHTYPEI